MVFRFQKASCVVVGTFNIHILHPQWLARRGIIQQGLEIGVETNLTRPGIRLRFPEHGALWSLSPDRLVIETDDAVFDCGQLAAQVLRILPETPVFGLGNNLHCVADPAEAGDLPRVLREFPEADGGLPPLETVQRMLHLALSRGEHETMAVQQHRPKVLGFGWLGSARGDAERWRMGMWGGWVASRAEKMHNRGKAGWAAIGALGHR